MDYKLTDRLVTNGLQCSRDRLPLSSIDTPFCALAFNLPGSTGMGENTWTVLDAIPLPVFYPLTSRPNEVC